MLVLPRLDWQRLAAVLQGPSRLARIPLRAAQMEALPQPASSALRVTQFPWRERRL